MKTFNFVPLVSDPKRRTYLASLVTTASLICGLYFLGDGFVPNDFKILQNIGTSNEPGSCTNRCRPPGSEPLPQGIVAKTSDLEMRPLWGRNVSDDNASNRSASLLAMAAGIKQKELVDKIVSKFVGSGVAVMVFHYDACVDEWNDLAWASRAVHVSAVNQTKWWFAKRFLHPDIVAQYDYVFLWDEDLGVEHFDPGRYLSIVKEEGLDISQPALDPAKSVIHHQITVRRRNSKVHRRYVKLKGGRRCYGNSTGPPCLGWVEMMAPVFSKAAWRCVWYLIQNDLIHGWGIDFQLGYCAQGDRREKVGVVDAEYIVHVGVPSLGGANHAKHTEAKNVTTDSDDFVPTLINNDLHPGDDRSEVRRQSYIEMHIFQRRWRNAVQNDTCWVDPYKIETNKEKCNSLTC